MDAATYLTFAMLGLAAGAMTAFLAQGLILAYRGSGVVNFAHGAMALFIAYLFNSLRDTGTLFIPPLPNPLSLVEGIAHKLGAGDVDLWDIPTQWTVADGGMNLWLAMFISMAVAIFLGWLIHVLIFRPIRDASPLTKVVASVGLMLLLQAIVILRFGPDPIATQTLLPQGTTEVGLAIVPVDRWYLVGGVVVVTAVLALVFKYTYLGIATRAAAENERAAMFIGLSPNRLAGVNWMLSAALAGGAGIAFASVTGLDPNVYVLLIVPALSAAMIARFTSFTIAAIAGFGIGILQSLVLPLQAQFTWLPQVGFGTIVPFIVLAITMMFMGVGLPTRSTVTKFKLPRATRPSHPKRMTLIWGVIAAVLIIFLPYDWRSAITVSLAAMIVAASLYVLVGLAGQISLMQMAIVAMASLAMTRLAGDWGIPFPLSPILAVLAATLFGVITGLFAFRLRGVELAVLTLAAAGAFADVILNNQEFVRPIDMGQSIPAPSIFGLDIGPAATFPFGAGGTPSAWFGLFVLVVAIGCLSAAMWLRNNKLGLRFLAMRSNERAATALGIDLRINKMTAIAISSAMAGVAGVIAGYTFGGLSASQYTAFASLAIVAAAFLGGISMISGSMVAGLAATGGFFTITMNHVFHYGEVEIAVAAFFLILVAVQQPEGIAGFNEQAFYHLRGKIRGKIAARKNPTPTEAPPAVPVTSSAGPPPD